MSDTARSPTLAVLAEPRFSRFYAGAFLSNIGTWMQNVVLTALAYDLTGSSTFVSIIVFAQLGPFLFFSMVGGLIADSFDRRKLLISIQVTQATISLLLAILTQNADPNRGLLVALVLLLGLGQAVNGPTFAAVIPDLAGPGNLAGAISLNSTQMNGARVIGPAIGGFLFARYGAPWVFTLNAISYAALIAALAGLDLPKPAKDESGESRLARLALGLRIARGRHPVGRSLAVMCTFSLLCLPFIGQMPVLADRNLGIDAKSTSYGVLYACFGIGAMIGALSVGTIFARVDHERLVRGTLVAFAIALGVLAWLRVPAPAFAAITVVGFFYFATVTALSTLLQLHLGASERGRVMALWMMAFGGTVPLGNLIAGPIIDATSVTTVVFPGAVAAVALAWWADLQSRPGDSVPEDPAT